MSNPDSIRLGELVEHFGGQLIGDPNQLVQGIAPLEHADANSITFLSNPKLRKQAAETHAAAVVIKAGDADFIQSQFKGALILTDNPYAWFAKAAQLFAGRKKMPVVPGIHPSANVDPSAKIAKSAQIGPLVCIEADVVVEDDVQIDAGCFIGRGARIGAQSHFHANVSWHHECSIGRRGIIYSGAVIGGEGFGFANEAGRWIKIPQTGRVLVGDDVEIGANTCIDRGTLNDTIIDDGVKLDNQIQIGHNCHIGAHTAIAGCVGVAGSTVIGSHCTIGGAANLSGHIIIADRVHVIGGSTVFKSITEAGPYGGVYPLARQAEWEKTQFLVRKLDAMRDKMRAMDKAIQSLLNSQSVSNHEDNHD